MLLIAIQISIITYEELHIPHQNRKEVLTALKKNSILSPLKHPQRVFTSIKLENPLNVETSFLGLGIKYFFYCNARIKATKDLLVVVVVT